MADRDFALPQAFIDGHVEEHVRDTMRDWFAWYLERFDRADGLPASKATARPRTYDVSSDEARWPEQAPPSLLVVCPGTVGDLQEHGASEDLAAWLQVNVSVTAGAATETGVRRISHRLCGAAREILAHQVPGGPVDRVRLLGWRTDLVTRERGLLACGIRAALRVDSVVQMRGHTPDLPPPVGQPGSYLVPDQTRVDVHLSPPETT